MCGRYAITLPPEAMRTFHRYVERPNFPARYNVAPTQPVPIVRAGEDGARHFALVRWAFLPAFAKDPKDFPTLINARAETVASKPSFRAAIKRRRCLFLADGFYEWLRPPAGAAKAPPRPFLVRRADEAPLAFAGIWEIWSDRSSGGEIDGACILTRPSWGALATIHDRAPSMIERRDFDAWLDPAAQDGDAAAALAVAASPTLSTVEIDARVNKVGADGPELQRPLGAP